IMFSTPLEIMPAISLGTIFAVSPDSMFTTSSDVTSVNIKPGFLVSVNTSSLVVTMLNLSPDEKQKYKQDEQQKGAENRRIAVVELTERVHDRYWHVEES
ncbi:701_t:CDS:2, partial [Gigaspora margarita]